MNLIELGQGVFALTHPKPKYGNSNVGLVIDTDGLTIFDTTATPQNGLVARQAILELTSSLNLPIKRVVLSSSRVPFSGGGQAFWAAAFYGSEATSDQLDLPPNPDAFRRLLPDFAQSYPDEFENRPITHTVSENAWLTPAASVLPLSGESAANLVVRLEAANVVFGGALASFGVTPLGYDGDLVAWADSLEKIAELGTTVIPGHGPPGGAADIADQIAYIRACFTANGDVARLANGPWETWTDRRFDAVNVERAMLLASGLDHVPRSMIELLGL